MSQSRFVSLGMTARGQGWNTSKLAIAMAGMHIFPLPLNCCQKGKLSGIGCELEPRESFGCPWLGRIQPLHKCWSNRKFIEIKMKICKMWLPTWTLLPLIKVPLKMQSAEYYSYYQEGLTWQLLSTMLVMSPWLLIVTPGCSDTVPDPCPAPKMGIISYIDFSLCVSILSLCFQPSSDPLTCDKYWSLCTRDQHKKAAESLLSATAYHMDLLIYLFQNSTSSLI